MQSEQGQGQGKQRSGHHGQPTQRCLALNHRPRAQGRHMGFGFCKWHAASVVTPVGGWEAVPVSPGQLLQPQV